MQQEDNNSSNSVFLASKSQLQIVCIDQKFAAPQVFSHSSFVSNLFLFPWQPP